MLVSCSRDAKTRAVAKASRTSTSSISCHLNCRPSKIHHNQLAISFLQKPRKVLKAQLKKNEKRGGKKRTSPHPLPL
jgi:hypothetical protein